MLSNAGGRRGLGSRHEALGKPLMLGWKRVGMFDSVVALTATDAAKHSRLSSALLGKARSVTARSTRLVVV